MKKLLALMILIPGLSLTSGVKQEVFQSPILIGEGTLKVLMWNIYDLRLYTDGTIFSWQNKFMLEFTYKREVKKDSVVDASLKEFRLQSDITEKEIQDWKEYLEQAVSSVQKGDISIAEWDPKGKIKFYYNGTAPITIENKKFARAFLNIWLGEETSRPALRSLILGSN
jgi:hypothetical protein